MGTRARKPTAKAAQSAKVTKKGNPGKNDAETEAKNVDVETFIKAFFPGKGGNASSAHGGGKTKLDWQWEVAKQVFSKHEKYQAVFELAVGMPAAQKAWAQKIKNRINRLVKQTNKYVDELGATGAGIERKEDIDMSVSNDFVNQWHTSCSICRSQLRLTHMPASRPNIVVTGIGNSATLTRSPSPTGSDDEYDPIPEVSTPLDLDTIDTINAINAASESDDDAIKAVLDNFVARDDDDGDVKPVLKTPKHKLKDVEKCKPQIKETGSAAVPSAKKKKIQGQFEDLVTAEETSRQMELDVQKVRIQADSQRTVRKADLKELELKLTREDTKEKRKLLELRMMHKDKELEHEHELTILRLRMGFQSGQALVAQVLQPQPFIPGPTLNSNHQGQSANLASGTSIVKDPFLHSFDFSMGDGGAGSAEN
ncbi:hypothetical protein EVG20_g9762 [Dentipellis fragilis]|uniref:No apical meristem-associated C-terminal domain-containing protein n=1 Tax=Dentipellis fragilis TaxID=205917 RepID=A0A4Y9XWZ2_9AGAM|nr:hypothetical protein EVG20_g9762 [Dentipellis fragilis]